MIHVGGHHEYIRGCSVHWGDAKSTSEDIMSTSGRYPEYIGGCSVHWSFQYKLKGFSQVAPPHVS